MPGSSALGDQMTPWERVRAMHAGAVLDRFPCVPFMGEMKCALTGTSYRDFWFDPQAMFEVERAAYVRWGYDRIVVGPNSRGITEALGGATEYPHAGLPHEGAPVVDDYAVLDAMEPVDPAASPRLAPFFRAIDLLVDSFGDEVPIEASIGGPMTIASNLRGIERLLRDCRRAPRQVERLLQLVAETQARCIDAAAAHGAGVAMADPVANPALIGAARYEEFVFPVTLRLCEHARSACGRGASLHMCGHTESIWHLFRRYPLGEVSLDNIVDLVQAARDLGSSVPIAGNVDPVHVISLGSPAEIEADVRRAVSQGSRSASGFTLASGCDIPPGTDLHQVDLFMDACRTVGA